MFHPFRADQLIGQPLNLSGSVAHHNHLKAVMGVEMDVQCGNDCIMMRVLVLGELVLEVASMVIVDQGDGADGWSCVGAVYLILD